MLHAPRSTYLPKEIQLSLPVFTRRGVGDFEGKKAQPSQPGPLCEQKNAGAHWVEQPREAPRANFCLRGDQSSLDDTQRARGAESLWEKVKSKTADSKLPCVTEASGDSGKGSPTHTESPGSLPSSSPAQAKSPSRVERRSQARLSNRFCLGRRLPALPSSRGGGGGTGWPPPLGLQGSLQRAAVSALCTLRFCSGHHFRRHPKTAGYRQSCSQPANRLWVACEFRIPELQKGSRSGSLMTWLQFLGNHLNS